MDENLKRKKVLIAIYELEMQESKISIVLRTIKERTNLPSEDVHNSLLFLKEMNCINAKVDRLSDFTTKQKFFFRDIITKVRGKQIVENKAWWVLKIGALPDIEWTIQQNIRNYGIIGEITQQVEINIQEIEKNAPPELDELKKYMQDKPNLTEWLKTIPQIIPSIIPFLRLFGVNI